MAKRKHKTPLFTFVNAHPIIHLDQFAGKYPLVDISAGYIDNDPTGGMLVRVVFKPKTKRPEYFKHYTSETYLNAGEWLVDPKYDQCARDKINILANALSNTLSREYRKARR